MPLLSGNFQSTTATSGTTVTVTKPTRADGSAIAVGDTLLGIAFSSGGATAAISLTGWTAGPSALATNVSIVTLWKNATSTETAATNFAFTISNITFPITVVLVAVQGSLDAASLTDTSASLQDGTNSSTYDAPTVTPTKAGDTLLCLWVAGANSITGSTTASVPGALTALLGSGGINAGATTPKMVSQAGWAYSPTTAATGAKTVTLSQAGGRAQGMSILLSAKTQSTTITQSSTVTPLKQASRAVALTQGSTLALLKTANRAVALTQGSAVSLVKTASLVKTITQASTVTFTKSLAAFRAFTISASSAVSIKKTASRAVSVAQSSSVSIVKTTTKRMSVATSSFISITLPEAILWLIGRWGGK